MAQREFFVLQEKHIGRKVFRAFGRRWLLGFRIRRRDVGRRVYETAGGRIEFEEFAPDFVSVPCSELGENYTEIRHTEFVTLEKQHVGQSIIKAFGSLWYVGRQIRQFDVGKRLYHTSENNVEMEPDKGAPAYPDVHSHVFEICDSLHVSLLREICDDTYALGQPRLGGAITPWYDTIDELERFCKENIETYRCRIMVM
jgi:hypothetical protein